MLTRIKRFFNWLLCPCTAVNRKHTRSTVPGWSYTTCLACGRMRAHFQDGSWRVK